MILQVLRRAILTQKSKEYKAKKAAQHKPSTIKVQEPLNKKMQAYYYKIQPCSHVIYWFLRKAYYMFGVPNAEELEYYKAHDVNNILWIEADPEAANKLKQITIISTI